MATNKFTCSIIIPTRNEMGNIEKCISLIPYLGIYTEMIFVDGASTDGTVEKIEEMIKKYAGQKDIKLIHQDGPFGKCDAVKKGFAEAKGDILIILDADLTVSPDDLSRFYLALIEGRGELIIGSRFVYPMEKYAMRFLNIIGNKMFSFVVSWLLGQRITDSLCGTKALFRKNYLQIAKEKSSFWGIDPYGDFELLFGANKLNLKIIEVPVKYHKRSYGKTKISRFKDGWLLLKMCLIAFKKFKLNK